MKALWMILIVMLLPATGIAAEAAPADNGRQGHAVDVHEMDVEPQKEGKIQKYAEEASNGPQKNFGVQPVHDNEVFAIFFGDRFEYQSREGDGAFVWDVLGWVGTDYNKLYIESEGEWLIDPEEFEEVQVELLYGRTLGTFWDLQVGVRHDFKPEPTRTFAALGVQGLAPYWFEVDATAYVSEDGDVSAALEVEYDLLLSQRFILQPRLETTVAVQEVEEYGIGQGINDIELGARLRYEVRREFAPYIGLSWNRKIGETADLAEAENEDIDAVSFVFGIRFWL